ncbi:MAG: hypothetical protein AAF443_00515 [Chlamydiota bacterium]
MIARSISLVHFCRAAKIFNGVIIGGALLLAVAGFCFREASRKSGTRTLPQPANIVAQGETSLSVKTALSQGAFQLDREITGLTFLDLGDQLRLFGQATRPDVSFQDSQLQIGTQRGQKKTVVLGQKEYLSFSPAGELHFVDDPGPFWLELSLTPEKKVVANLGLAPIDLEATALKEDRRSFAVKEATKMRHQEKEDTTFSLALTALETGKWWGIDRLFETYGGEKYTKLKKCQRIAHLVAGKPVVLYLQEGDFISWNGAHWALIKLGEKTQGRPLARMHAVSSYEICWEVWDVSGLRKEEVRQTREKEKNLDYRAEKVFSRIRQRTGASVSCRVGNKNVLLKKGDWLLKSKLGWKTLKSIQDVQDVLNFKLEGDLFVFDGVEKGDKGQVFVGTFFNAMRTQLRQVSLPITRKKKTQHSTHAKNLISSKIRSAMQEDQREEDSSRAQIKKSTRKKRRFDRRDVEEGT